MTLFKYILIGLINSIAGYALIIGLMLLGYTPEVSNICGYLLGVSISYILNRQFNFKNKSRHSDLLPKYLTGMAIAYLLNLVTLVVLFRLIGIDPYISQLAAAAVYLLAGYGLSKAWIFRENELPLPETKSE